MAVIIWQGKNMASVLEGLRSRLSEVTFVPAESFCWSPKNSTIMYNEATLSENTGTWALLHEAGHALLGHRSYKTDVELLMLEVEAWQAAKDLARDNGINIDDEHIQDCLDTYRDWLHQRSTCPACGVVCLQDTPRSYRCHNCHNCWLVSASRFCRPYRLNRHMADPESLENTTARATFQ
jgi:hypothetical protein